MLTTLLLTATLAAPGGAKDGPKAVEVFAADEAYKKQNAKAQEFIGQLIRTEKSGSKSPRKNPYRLTVVRYEEVAQERIENGQTVRVKVKVPVTVLYELYVAGKTELLEPFVNKHVKIVGKVVNADVDGKPWPEVWPGSVEVADPKDAPKGEEPKAKLPPPPANAPALQNDSPKAVEVFAREDFYKKHDASEQEFSGHLQRLSAPPGAAVGPSHPYRLVTIKSEQREREVLVNGKAVKRPYTIQYLVVHDLYVDGRGELLDPLVGKQVKVIGKSVKSESNGDPEVWPGRVEVVAPPQPPAPPPNSPALQKDPPKTVEIFAKDDFYQKQDAKEETIAGTVQRINQSGAKTGRNNPYRLTGTTYREVERQRVVNGKVEKYTEKVPITVNYDLYVAGKGELLEQFVGKRVKITGKPVQVEVGGKTYKEFWPGTVELDDSKDAPKKEDPRPKLPPPPANVPVQQKDAPKAVEVFAKEEFYQKEKGKEDTFTGTIQRAEKAGPGFGRNNPYRLTVITYKEVTVERVVNGKVEKTTEKVPLASNYELYVAGKGELLEPFIGKQVKVTGKRVLMEVEGKKHDEIWPARIELEEAKKPQAPSDDGCCTDDGDTPLKILAKAHWPFENANPKDAGKPGRQLVFRSLDEMIAVAPYVNRDAPPEAVKQAAAADMAKFFKVDAIDWKKQMIVVVTGGVQNSGGYKIDIASVTVADKKITVTWRLDPPKGVATNAFTHPSVMALVERAEGEVRFVQPPAGKLELPKKER
jgi:hypothetical protein